MIFLNNHRDRANGGYATYKWFMKLAHEYFKFYKENEKVQFTWYVVVVVLNSNVMQNLKAVKLQCVSAKSVGKKLEHIKKVLNLFEIVTIFI